MSFNLGLTSIQQQKTFVANSGNKKLKNQNHYDQYDDQRLIKKGDFTDNAYILQNDLNDWNGFFISTLASSLVSNFNNAFSWV